MVTIKGNEIEFKEEREENIEDIYQRVFEDAPVGMALLSKELLLLRVNNKLCSILGYQLSEIISLPFNTILSPDNSHLNFTIKKLLSGEISEYHSELQMLQKTGDHIWIDLTLRRIEDLVGNHYILPIIIDISKQKENEEKLIQKKEKLDILTTITRHDIQNQIQALNAFCDLLALKIPENTECREYLSYIIKCSDNINQHIEFNRDYQVLGENEPIWQKIETIAKIAAIDNLPESITLSIEISNLSIYADPMLMLAFYNLFDNTKKYGEKTSLIKVDFIIDSEFGVLIVEDNGIGIPSSMKNKIFEKGFGQNSGLGLYLVKEILAITGLSIHENGIKEKGARFEIIVPHGKWKI